MSECKRMPTVCQFKGPQMTIIGDTQKFYESHKQIMPWLQLELYGSSFIAGISILGHKESSINNKRGLLETLDVRVGYYKHFEGKFPMITKNEQCARYQGTAINEKLETHIMCNYENNLVAIAGRFVSVQKISRTEDILAVGEIFVMSKNGKFITYNL